MSLLWNRMSLLWNRMLLIMHETAASQDRPGRHPGPPPRVGTSIGTCLSPNRQGTPGSPACARYGKETPVMERKRRLWKISDLYGKKATFMENKRPLWKESVVLWKIKFTYGKKVLVWPLYGKNSRTYGKKKYQLIFTLNVCATQELYKLIQKQEKIINDLISRIAKLENQNL